MPSFTDPVILFFLFGLFAGACRSNLEIPPAISRFLSLYLLMALGLKGGFAIAKTGMTNQVILSLACAIGLAIIIPLLAYQVLRLFISSFDAAAVAATYGSVSAVTFITATQVLEQRHIDFGGYMAAAMALMESPAMIIAIFFANRQRQKLTANRNLSATSSHTDSPHSISKLLHESLTDGAQLLLIGSLLIGIISGATGEAIMRPFSVDLFKGLLAFFLLDMGLLAARNLSGLRQQSPWILVFAVVAPLCHAAIALSLAWVCQVSLGDAILLMVLASSASYIAVPAVIRYAIPEANPSLYIGMSLGLTFPLNLLCGIPLYISIASQLYGFAAP
ncbi:sodium-dependent bicarbonate transport family permease [Undibacterium fentianense]|uniref:Sodium-dependent bicarbonate transport family permease n=1 Tax=Undibacterium fentianense TaxID=2828728 RepID=A0A941E3A9_9BURK|nr:sodium-dependent bicarbonate transport family permease [Undibacterium fentianense]MBR7801565.1 sodium-dependent bicarbonate transport family permease [Undibacterium fentianense]